MERSLSLRIQESQEELAGVMKRSFDHTDAQVRGVEAQLSLVAEALGVDIEKVKGGVADSTTLTTFRTEMDALAHRVKTLEEKKA